MKIVSCVFIAVFCTGLSVHAQRKLKQLDEENKKDDTKTAPAHTDEWKDKFIFGGNAWGGFTSYGTFFTLQPWVGYKLRPKTIVGVGASYLYQTVNVPPYPAYSESVYGPSLFVRQYIAEPIFLYGEYQALNFLAYDAFNQLHRVWDSRLLLGGGYGASRGGYALVLYDVIWNRTSSHWSSPLVIRVGFAF
jgi:hypothetical protein